MVFHAIKTLVDSGINEIILVSGGSFSSEFMKVIGDGDELGIKNICYTVQKEAKGIAHALATAEVWSGNDSVSLILGDNIFEDNFKNVVEKFDKGSKIFLKEVCNPEIYGVAEIDDNKNVISLEEKPSNPKSNLIATGLYIYDNTVWDRIRTLKPSARGEYEITDLNKNYLSSNELKSHILNGWWADCGGSLSEYTKTCFEFYQRGNL
jgi:glucose-1-phosphate thymidylyltransferase